MSCRPAVTVFRSCASSYAARAAARPSLNAARRRFAGVRPYSAQADAEQKPAEGTGAGEGAPEGSPAEKECQEKLKKKEDEVQDLVGRLRYLQADFLNLQRNAAREKEQQRDFAISKFAGDLLETVDVLAMALKSVPASAIKPPAGDAPSNAADKSADHHLYDLHHGVEMTHRLLLQTLFKYQVKPFDPTGEQFDPNRHEALYQAPIPGKEPGTVLECQKTGYMIKDRVLRAAQVGVVQDTSS
ncbi:GrpE-domain-containing protein [Phanerochaete sordida]|uniref:GrpE protein homolog n=1 Tax=Phanerochaete sordida TaxID=48140 RepID=A0A9P3GAP3_9APHY|nr:GrpE-domain-containing protein [Phanerochaete sordida]